MQLYICDSERKIKDGKCNGNGCKHLDSVCYLTKDKEYAKEYITVLEMFKALKDGEEYYRLLDDEEKAKQYENAINTLTPIEVNFFKVENLSIGEIVNALNRK